MNKRLTYVLSTSLISVCLSACDPGGYYEYTITNESDSTVFVVYEVYANDTLKKAALAPGQSRMIHNYTALDGLYDYGDDFLQWFDSLAVFTDTVKMKVINRNWSLRNEWEYNAIVEGHHGLVPTGRDVYRFNVGPDDVK